MTPKIKEPINNDLIIYRLDEIKAELSEIKGAYVTKEESHALKMEISVLRADVADLKKVTTQEIERLKGTNQLKNTLLWVGLVASAIINVLVIYNLFTKE